MFNIEIDMFFCCHVTFWICEFAIFFIHYVIFILTCLLSNTTFCKAVIDCFNANLLLSILHPYGSLKNFNAFCNFLDKYFLSLQKLLSVLCFETWNKFQLQVISNVMLYSLEWKQSLSCYTCQSMMSDGLLRYPKIK